MCLHFKHSSCPGYVTFGNSPELIHPSPLLRQQHFTHKGLLSVKWCVYAHIQKVGWKATVKNLHVL